LDTTTGEVVQAFPKDLEEANLGLLHVAPAVGDGYLIIATQLPPSGFLGQARHIVMKLDIETGDALWDLDDAKGQYIEGGVIADGIFVIGNSDGNVYALDVETGELAWEKPFKTDHRVWAVPLVADDTVYIGSMDGHLYALRLSDGEKLWQFPPAGTPGAGAFASTPALQDGVLYIGTFANRVYAIDADEGTEIWRFPAEKPGDSWFWGSPVVDGDAVYAVDVKGTVYKLDAGTGEGIWDIKLAPKKNEKNVPVRGGPALTEDGSTLLISSENGSLYALDTADRSQMWVEESDGKGYVTPVVDGDIVYQALIQGSYRIRALEISDDGDELWVYPLPEESETGE
jgi:outer membrane protein assembly factor BamB